MSKVEEAKLAEEARKKQTDEEARQAIEAKNNAANAEILAKDKGNVEQSKTEGTVTDDSGRTATATSPAVPDGAFEKKLAAEGFTEQELEDLAANLKAGESGWLPLDEYGRVTGPAQTGVPPEGQLAAKVVAIAAPIPRILQTPSGAPISKTMNPSSEFQTKNAVDNSRAS